MHHSDQCPSSETGRHEPASGRWECAKRHPCNICNYCGKEIAPSGVDGGSWVVFPHDCSQPSPPQPVDWQARALSAEARAAQAEQERDDARNTLRMLARTLPAPPWWNEQDGSDWQPWAEWLRDQLASQGWQDIASAPKDGTPILCWSQFGRIVVAEWSCRANGGWNWNDTEYTFRPTHWMPLPAQPKERT